MVFVPMLLPSGNQVRPSAAKTGGVLPAATLVAFATSRPMVSVAIRSRQAAPTSVAVASTVVGAAVDALAAIVAEACLTAGVASATFYLIRKGGFLGSDCRPQEKMSRNLWPL